MVKSLPAIKGFKASGISAGIKKNGKKDLALITSETECHVAGVFTKSRVPAAPVAIDMERIKKGVSRGVIINSGNANACTGAKGLKDAQKILTSAESRAGVKKGDFLIASTGVIGVPLQKGKILNAIADLIEALSPHGFRDAAEAIMTTDAFAKTAFGKIKISDSTVNILGIAKGAGMICPNMATMLCFFITDANIKSSALSKALRTAVEDSFNRIIVDNDASTNDTVLVFANGLSGGGEISAGSNGFKMFSGLLTELSLKLSRMIVEDGEGATRFVEILLRGAKNDGDAKKAARTIASSMLVKTAFFGGDPNWGRIMAALGSSGIELNPDKVDISVGGEKIVKNGVAAGREKKAKAAFKKKEIKVVMDLNIGRGYYKLWTTDLTHDYVRINSAYRT